VSESLATRQARWIDSWCSRTRTSAICRFADGLIALGSGHPCWRRSRAPGPRTSVSALRSRPRLPQPLPRCAAIASAVRPTLACWRARASATGSGAGAASARPM
jgi:hypothetical protein